MKIQRRTFLKTSVAAAGVATLASTARAAAGGSSAAGRELYDLRAYRLKPGASAELLDGYLEKALLPALARHGIKDVGVFTEIEINRNDATSTPKADSPVWVLIPHPTFESYVNVCTEINTDAAVQKAGASYLDVPKATPAFDRIDAWLLLGFTGFPKHQLPAFHANPARVFELRTYESHSELKALNKIAMFNAGEIEVMKELGMSPVFYGQALAGKDLPHLSYITCGPDLKTHLANWKKFGSHPIWMKLKNDPQYADNTSKTAPSRFLVPKTYSMI